MPPQEGRALSQPARRSHGAWVAVGLPTLLAAIVYANAAGAPFLYDDAEYVVQAAELSNVGNLPRLWISSFPAHRPYYGLYRPMTATTYLLDRAVFGLDARAHHATNIALHALATLLFAVLLLVMGIGLREVAFAACLFGVHPIHTEAVSWVTGRSEVLAGLFVFGSVAAWVRFRRGRGARWAAASGVAYFAAVASKESAVALPAVLLLAEALSLLGPAREQAARGLFSWARSAATPRQRKRHVAPAFPWRVVFCPYGWHAVALALFLGLRWKALGRMTGVAEISAFHGDPASTRIATALAGLGRYLSKSVWPFDLRIIYEKSPELLSAWPLLGLGAVAALAVAAWKLRIRQPLGALWAVWFFGFLAVVSNLAFPIGSAFAERFLYLPSAAVCAIAAAVWASSSAFAGTGQEGRAPAEEGRNPPGDTTLRRARCLSGIAIACAVLAAFSWATIRRNEVWSDELTFWRVAMAQSPGSEKAHENLAAVLRARGKVSPGLLSEAEEVLRAGIALQPRNARTLTGEHLRMLQALAEVLRDARRFPEALAVYEQLSPLLYRYPSLPETLRFKGLVSHGEGLVASGRSGEAVAHYARVKSVFSRVPLVLLGQGNALRAHGELDSAIGSYREALALEPSNAIAWVSLALVLLERGRAGEALKACLEALRLGEVLYTANAIRQAAERLGPADPLPPQVARELLEEMGRRLPGDGALQDARARLGAVAAN